MTDRDESAKHIVDKHVMYAAGVGLVPLPVVDMAALVALNVKMIKELSIHYEIEFSDDKIKAAVLSLIGAVGAGTIAQSRGVSHVLRLVPLVGHVLATVSMSIFGSAATYAVGHVFLRHYESGGTLLDFNADKAKSAMTEQYEKGKNVFRKKPAATTEEAPSPA